MHICRVPGSEEVLLKKSCLVVTGNRFVRSVERAWGEEAEEQTLRSRDKSVWCRVSSWPSQAPLTASLCLSSLAVLRVDSIMLVEEGFSVTSVDASDKMLKYALKERWNRRHEPAFDKWVIEEANWMTLDKDVPQSAEGGFDAVICLGNSFAHLPDCKGKRPNEPQIQSPKTPLLKDKVSQSQRTNKSTTRACPESWWGKGMHMDFLIFLTDHTHLEGKSYACPSASPMTAMRALRGCVSPGMWPTHPHQWEKLLLH
nr:glycine N-methyltransferase isoform X4 [Pan paniscus]